MNKTHCLIPIMLGIGVASLAILPENPFQHNAYASEKERCIFREASPAGQALNSTPLTNITGNTTGNTTELREYANMTGEPSTPAANPVGITEQTSQ